MSSPFNANAVTTPGGPARLVLVNGRTFMVAAADGAVRRPADGVVFEDMRLLSRFEVAIGPTAEAAPAETLAAAAPSPFHAVVVSRPAAPDRENEPAEYFVQRQWVGRGVRYDVELHNAGDEPIRRIVSIALDTDFAHLFDMKAGVGGATQARLEWDGDGGSLVDPADADRWVSIACSPTPAAVDRRNKRVTWELECPPDDRSTVSLTCEPWWDGVAAGLAFPLGAAPHTAVPAQRLDRQRRLAPTVVTDDARLAGAVEQSVADLAALQVFDRDHPERVVIAAGAPWFMTVFGRDSLLTAWMVMPFLPELVIGTIDTLAGLQGETDRPETEEQPGKILHELRRHGPDAAFAHRGRYYGTVDATPLFVMVVAEAMRWGHLDLAGLRQRWPNVVAAVGWVRRTIAGDPTGFVRYHRSTPTGLVNQGWKDSWDGISCADGRIPSGPLAVAEVQGYAYAALRDAAWLAEQLDDGALDAATLRREADELAGRFDAAFWSRTAGYYHVGVDDTGAPIDSLTTNPGHAVWAGICDPGKASRYLARAVDGDLFSGWGLRTLAPTCARYNPLSYHNGSVWPHDTALVAAGAHRAGRADLAATLFDAALDVTAHAGGRPPELFAGIDRDEIGVPVPYPSSCSPQAWASASTLLYLRGELGLEPPAPGSPAPGAGAATNPRLSRLTGIRAGGRWFTAHAARGRWVVAEDPTP
jgi:glycogen debranching enzyme